jgi:hypothetical protein
MINLFSKDYKNLQLCLKVPSGQLNQPESDTIGPGYCKRQSLYFLTFSNLKGLSHEMDLALDDMYG